MRLATVNVFFRRRSLARPCVLLALAISFHSGGAFRRRRCYCYLFAGCVYYCVVYRTRHFCFACFFCLHSV